MTEHTKAHVVRLPDDLIAKCNEWAAKTRKAAIMSEIKLFQVHSRADLDGYSDVPIAWFVDKREGYLFGPGGSLNIEVCDAIPDYEGSYHGYDTADHLEEYFTEHEAKAFVDWLEAFRPQCAATMMEQVQFPRPNNIMSFRSIPVGGAQDFLMTGDAPDYALPFKVWGYYDLRGCIRR
jgi:hypothetical protein